MKNFKGQATPNAASGPKPHASSKAGVRRRSSRWNVLVAVLCLLGTAAVFGYAASLAGWIPPAKTTLSMLMPDTESAAKNQPHGADNLLPAHNIVAADETSKSMHPVPVDPHALPKGALLMGYIVPIEANDSDTDVLVVKILDVIKNKSGERTRLDDECYLIAPAKLYKSEFVRPAEVRCYGPDAQVDYAYSDVRGQVIHGDKVPDLASLDPAYSVSNNYVIVVLTEPAKSI